MHSCIQLIKFTSSNKAQVWMHFCCLRLCIFLYTFRWKIEDSFIIFPCRQKFQCLEVAVLEYQESLEEQGMHSKQEIDKKVENHHRHLQSEFGQLDSADDQSSNKHPTLKFYLKIK